MEISEYQSIKNTKQVYHTKQKLVKKAQNKKKHTPSSLQMWTIYSIDGLRCHIRTQPAAKKNNLLKEIKNEELVFQRTDQAQWENRKLAS